MDQYQCREKLSKNFQDHWSIRISPGKGMDQWLVHIRISPEISMDQWRSKFSESFSLDRYWSIECSSLHIAVCGSSCASRKRQQQPKAPSAGAEAEERETFSARSAPVCEGTACKQARGRPLTCGSQKPKFQQPLGRPRKEPSKKKQQMLEIITHHMMTLAFTTIISDMT